MPNFHIRGIIVARNFSYHQYCRDHNKCAKTRQIHLARHIARTTVEQSFSDKMRNQIVLSPKKANVPTLILTGHKERTGVDKNWGSSLFEIYATCTLCKFSSSAWWSSGAAAKSKLEIARGTFLRYLVHTGAALVAVELRLDVKHTTHIVTIEVVRECQSPTMLLILPASLPLPFLLDVPKRHI